MKKVTCFEYDDCLDALRQLIMFGLLSGKIDVKIWDDRSPQNRSNRVEAVKSYIRRAMRIMSTLPGEPTQIKDLTRLTKKGVDSTFLIELLDEKLNVGPISFFSKIWRILESTKNADALACFSNRQDRVYDELLAAQKKNGSVFEFLEALHGAEKERRADEGSSKPLTLIKVLLNREIDQHLTGMPHEKIKEGIKLINDDQFIVEGDLKWDAENIPRESRPVVANDIVIAIVNHVDHIDGNVYKSLVAFHIMKKSREIFPGEEMILVDYWGNTHIKSVFDFFSQNQDLIPAKITMNFTECMPLLECGRKQELFTTLSSPGNSMKKRKREESYLSTSRMRRTNDSPGLPPEGSCSSTSTIHSPGLPLEESYMSTSTINSPGLELDESSSSTSTVRSTTYSPGLPDIF
ncbi:MAG: hypothetical protein CMF46_01860 [Legionellales bacterium]|nr:hypothetical protein [Legionellales bacterium]|tara:strand:+ start:2308 stop:3525 length:1218 start_codon:yes stop_codon:yes gene_type:complete